MPTVFFEQENKRVEVAEGTKLRDVMRAEGIGGVTGLSNRVHLHGFFFPNNCLVRVTGMQKAGKRSADEEEVIRGNFLIAREAPEDVRVACMLPVNGDMNVLTSPTLHSDPKETRNRVQFTVALGLFGVPVLIAIAYIVLDLAGAI